MSRSEIIDAAMLASIVGITVSLLMMIGSTVYLNKSKCRFRFFELGMVCKTSACSPECETVTA